MPRVNPHELNARASAEWKNGKCLHGDIAGAICDRPATDSHTVQRRGGLAAIAEDGHVLTALTNFHALNSSDGKPEPRRVGIGAASTYPGFCNAHDTALFRPIEGADIELNAEAALLFAYRAIGYELFGKRAAIRMAEVTRDADLGQPYVRQRQLAMMLDPYIDGLRLGLSDAEQWIAAYRALFHNRQLPGFGFTAARFDRVIPFVACGGFHVECDLAGRRLQKLGIATNPPPESIAFNVTSFGGKSTAILAWIGRPDGPGFQFAKSFSEVPHARLAAAVTRVAFEHVGNIFFRPSWWAGLSEERRTELKLRISSGAPSNALRNDDCLVDKGESDVLAEVIEFTAPTMPNS